MAFPLYRILRRGSIGAPALSWMGSLVLTGLVAWVCLGCGKPGRSMPNVILVSMDTLRAQNMACYGYPRPTTPRMDAFANGATLYRRAFASSSWTVPTHASMFTGLNPVEHGARIFKVDVNKYIQGTLDKTHPTLAERLAGEGYATAAFVANSAMLGKSSGANRGFNLYHDELMKARDLNDRQVFPWLETHGGEHPFFLFLNYMDVHEPYNCEPHQGFLDDLTDRDSRAVLESVRGPVMMRQRPLPEKELRLLTDQYDTAIRNLDTQVGRLLDKLRELGLYDSTLIILTSDHGEYFGEHDLITHWKDLYQEVLWIPLIIKAPGQQEGRVEAEAVVSHVDFPGMILRALPNGVSKDHLPDFPRVPGNHPVISEIHYIAQTLMDKRPWRDRLDRERTALIEWPMKFIKSSDGMDEMYDLERDFAEQNDLIPNDPAKAEAMRQSLGDYLATLRVHPPPGEAPSDPTEDGKERLRELGYL